MAQHRAYREAEGFERLADRLIVGLLLRVGIAPAHGEFLAVEAAPAGRIQGIAIADQAGAVVLALPSRRRDEGVDIAILAHHVRGAEEAAMTALSDILPERRGGDDQRFRRFEIRAAVVGAKRQDRVPPALQVALEETAAGMMIGVVLIVDQGGDALAVARPSRGQVAAAIVGRGIGILRRMQRHMTVDLQMREVWPTQGPRLEMQCEHDDRAVRGAKGARVDVGHVDGRAPVGRGVEDFFGAAVDGEFQRGQGLRRCGRGLEEQRCCRDTCGTSRQGAVMPGLVPGVHADPFRLMWTELGIPTAWMAGTSPAMTGLRTSTHFPPLSARTASPRECTYRAAATSSRCNRDRIPRASGSSPVCRSRRASR